MNDYICSGLYSPDLLWMGGIKQLDKDGLSLAKDEDYMADDVLKTWALNPPKTLDDGVSACRRWYDYKNHGKGFCCQMYGDEDAYETFVIDCTGTRYQAPVVSFMGDVSFGALSFNTASKMASAVAMMMTAVAVTMN